MRWTDSYVVRKATSAAKTGHRDFMDLQHMTYKHIGYTGISTTNQWLTSVVAPTAVTL